MYDTCFAFCMQVKKMKSKKVGNPLRSFLWEGHLRSTMAAVAWVIEADWRWDVRCRRVAERNNHAEWKDNGGWRNIRGEGHVWCVTHPWDIPNIDNTNEWNISHISSVHFTYQQQFSTWRQRPILSSVKCDNRFKQ